MKCRLTAIAHVSPRLTDERRAAAKEGRVGHSRQGGTFRAMARVCVLSGAALALLLLTQPALATGRDSAFSPAAQRQATLYLGRLGAAPAFTKDDIITDVNFSDIYCLSQAAVQSFLAAQPGILDTYKIADHLGVKRSAAAIIWQAAQAWQVSPRVILATLQKEQGLLSATSPSTSALDWAMGCGVPDSGGHNSTYRGLRQTGLVRRRVAA